MTWKILAIIFMILYGLNYWTIEEKSKTIKIINQTLEVCKQRIEIYQEKCQ